MSTPRARERAGGEPRAMAVRAHGAPRALMLWTCAGLLALATHLGGALWLLRTPRLSAADDRPPAAVMIELAEMPEAVSTETSEISPDQQTAEASQPAQKVETPPEPRPEEMPEPADAPAEAAPETPRPVETPAATDEPVEETPVLDRVEVPLPAPRPKPPRRPKREDRKKPASRPQQAQASSRQALEARAQVAQSTRNAARQSASGASAAISPATWQARLMAHLERRKTYPPGSRARGEHGTVFVRFSIDTGGNVLSVALARSSGFADLDREVLALVRRASPVPPPPPAANTTITAPVRFNIR